MGARLGPQMWAVQRERRLTIWPKVGRRAGDGASTESSGCSWTRWNHFVPQAVWNIRDIRHCKQCNMCNVTQLLHTAGAIYLFSIIFGQRLDILDHRLLYTFCRGLWLDWIMSAQCIDRAAPETVRGVSAYTIYMAQLTARHCMRSRLTRRLERCQLYIVLWSVYLRYGNSRYLLCISDIWKHYNQSTSTNTTAPSLQ